MISSLFYLQSNSQVWIVRAWHSNDAHLGLNAGLKHSHTGLSTKKYNKVMEAESTTVKKHSEWHGVKSCDIFLLRSLGFVLFQFRPFTAFCKSLTDIPTITFSHRISRATKSGKSKKRELPFRQMCLFQLFFICLLFL